MDPVRQTIERTRREFLTTAAGGIGGLALASMLARDGFGVEKAPVNPLAPKPTHFKPRARNCIFIFLSGGASQVDLFDPKPRLTQLAGKPVPESFLKNARFAFIQKDSAVILPTPRTFKKHGACGMEFSDLLPHIGACADDICMIRSMHTEQFNHHPATIFMNSGFQRMGRPTIGSWLTYGLGSESADLPGYVVLEPGPGIRGGATNWSSGFLASTYAGVHLNLKGEPVHNLNEPPGLSRDVQRRSLDALAKLNEHRRQQNADPDVAARIASYELAFRMQRAVPELLDLSGEKPATLEAYGVNRDANLIARNEGNVTRAPDFSRACLLARRMVERGVRFINIYMDGWDHHGDIVKGLEANCTIVDQPIAALIKDLKQRGLLGETLVVWGTEFGRTPLGENRIGVPLITGRDHHPFAFTIWMAGGGITGGATYGATDEIGWNIVKDAVHVNDFHATLLHLFGLNHEALTYRFEGRDYRLTDVAGKVIQRWLA